MSAFSFDKPDVASDGPVEVRKSRHTLARLEGMTDYLVMAMIVVLAGAMLFGLATASG